MVFKRRELLFDLSKKTEGFLREVLFKLSQKMEESGRSERVWGEKVLQTKERTLTKVVGVGGMVESKVCPASNLGKQARKGRLGQAGGGFPFFFFLSLLAPNYAQVTWFQPP